MADLLAGTTTSNRGLLRLWRRFDDGRRGDLNIGQFESCVRHLAAQRAPRIEISPAELRQLWDPLERQDAGCGAASPGHVSLPTLVCYSRGAMLGDESRAAPPKNVRYRPSALFAGSGSGSQTGENHLADLARDAETISDLLAQAGTDVEIQASERKTKLAATKSAASSPTSSNGEMSLHERPTSVQGIWHVNGWDADGDEVPDEIFALWMTMDGTLVGGSVAGPVSSAATAPPREAGEETTFTISDVELRAHPGGTTLISFRQRYLCCIIIY